MIVIQARSRSTILNFGLSFLIHEEWTAISIRKFIYNVASCSVQRAVILQLQLNFKCIFLIVRSVNISGNQVILELVPNRELLTLLWTCNHMLNRHENWFKVHCQTKTFFCEITFTRLMHTHYAPLTTRKETFDLSPDPIRTAMTLMD